MSKTLVWLKGRTLTGSAGSSNCLLARDRAVLIKGALVRLYKLQALTHVQVSPGNSGSHWFDCFNSKKPWNSEQQMSQRLHAQAGYSVNMSESLQEPRSPGVCNGASPLMSCTVSSSTQEGWTDISCHWGSDRTPWLGVRTNCPQVSSHGTKMTPLEELKVTQRHPNSSSLMCYGQKHLKDVLEECRTATYGNRKWF